jgi:hypothetical protein
MFNKVKLNKQMQQLILEMRNQPSVTKTEPPVKQGENKMQLQQKKKLKLEQLMQKQKEKKKPKPRLKV